MKDVTNDVLKTIQKQNIKPTPKWEFKLKELFIMLLFCLNLIIGALGTSVVIYLLANNEALFDVSYVRSFGEWVIISIPIVWLTFTSIGLILSYIFLRKTKDSYRYELWVSALINIVLSLTIGSLIYFLGYTERLNQYFNDKLPMYSRYFDTRVNVWSRPEQGYLAGKIVGVDINLIVLDYENKRWVIDITDSNIKGRVVLRVGERIKILGIKTSDNIFKASEIRPWLNGMNSGRRGMQ